MKKIIFFFFIYNCLFGYFPKYKVSVSPSISYYIQDSYKDYFQNSYSFDFSVDINPNLGFLKKIRKLLKSFFFRISLESIFMNSDLVVDGALYFPSLSIVYAMPLSKKWSFDFDIGIGYYYMSLSYLSSDKSYFNLGFRTDMSIGYRLSKRFMLVGGVRYRQFLDKEKDIRLYGGGIGMKICFE